MRLQQEFERFDLDTDRYELTVSVESSAIRLGRLRSTPPELISFDFSVSSSTDKDYRSLITALGTARKITVTVDVEGYDEV